MQSFLFLGATLLLLILGAVVLGIYIAREEKARKARGEGSWRDKPPK
jgi:hypothetical protein